MSALKLELTYNPYTVKSVFKINGRTLGDGPLVDITSQKRLQQWIDKLFDVVLKTYNSKDINFLFIGTLLDSEDVKDAVFIYNKNSKSTIKLTCNTTNETVDNKVTKLKALYNEAKEGPFDEFRTDEMNLNFEGALAPEFEVNVIATMSSGKSTVINAMLGKELMPAKNEACTATIAKISDHDDETQFTAKRTDHKQDMIDDWQLADAKLMERWNDDKNTSIIEIKGNIPAVKERESIRLVLVDTPGPNNSRDSEHRQATTKAISAKNMSMVLYVLNATQLSTDDDKTLLNMIKEAMNQGGREAQDRFIFIANKIDNFDPEKGEFVGKALKNVKEYLQYNGIDNPIIVPASAELAKLLRVSEFEGKDSLTRRQRGDLTNYTDLFIEVPDMNMLEHVKDSISKSTYNSINERLQAEKGSNNDAKQAEILSGIPIVEALLDNFIAKHAIPAKLKDAVDSFSGVMAKAEGIDKLNELIEKNENDMQDIVDKLKKATEDKSTIKQANDFRSKVKSSKYHISVGAKKSRTHIDNKINDLLDELQGKFESEVKPSEAKMAFTKAERECEYLFDNIEEILSDAINKEQIESLNDFKDEYQEFVAKILDKSFPDDKDMEMRNFQSVSMSMPDTKLLLSNATREKKIKVHVGTERHGFLWLKKRDVYETHTEEFVDMSGPWAELENSIRVTKKENFDAFEKNAKNNYENAKDILLKQMDEIDNKMADTIESLSNAASDKEYQEKMLTEYKEKKEWYDNFVTKLDDILAI